MLIITLLFFLPFSLEGGHSLHEVRKVKRDGSLYCRACDRLLRCDGRHFISKGHKLKERKWRKKETSHYRPTTSEKSPAYTAALLRRNIQAKLLDCDDIGALLAAHAALSTAN